MRSLINLAKLVLPVLLIIITSCKNKPVPENFTPVTNQEIYDVINAVVKQERLDTINSNKKYSYKIIDSLENKTVYFPQPTKQFDGTFITFPPLIGGIVYQHLLYNKPKCFSIGDSTFFIYQNQHPKRLILTSGQLNFAPITNSNTYRQSLNKNIRYTTITFSVPLFSKNHNSAYIQVDFNIGTLGSGMEYFLLKIKGQWQVVKKYNTWMS